MKIFRVGTFLILSITFFLCLFFIIVILTEEQSDKLENLSLINRYYTLFDFCLFLFSTCILNARKLNLCLTIGSQQWRSQWRSPETEKCIFKSSENANVPPPKSERMEK